MLLFHKKNGGYFNRRFFIKNLPCFSARHIAYGYIQWPSYAPRR